jgi:hypothetical protein
LNEGAAKNEAFAGELVLQVLRQGGGGDEQAQACPPARNAPRN